MKATLDRPTDQRLPAAGTETPAAVVKGDRRTAVLVGALFLVATATFLISDSLLTPLLDAPDYLAQVGADDTLVVAAALLALVCGIAVVAIAALMFPLLKRHDEPIAVAYLGFRAVEVAALALCVLGPLLLLSLSRGLVDAGQGTEAVGTVLLGLREWTVHLVYLFSSIAGLVLCLGLLRSGLVPRVLAILGLVGYPVMVAGAALDMLGHIDTLHGAGMLAFVPGGLFEFVLPLWLFARGFRSPEIAPAPAPLPARA